MKHYKTKIKELKALTGLNIKELAEKLGCRRESIYYALRTKGTKSGLRKELDRLVSPEWKDHFSDKAVGAFVKLLAEKKEKGK